jgi:TonB family protein
MSIAAALGAYEKGSCMCFLSRSRFCLSICLLGLVSTGLFVVRGQEDLSWQAKFLSKEKEEELKQKAVRQPNDAKLQFQLADAYLEAERWGDAALALERVARLKPNSAVAQYYLGLCYGYLDKKEDAVRAYQIALAAPASKSLELFGDKILISDLLQSLAEEYEALRRYDEAIETWNELFRQSPSYTQPLYRIGLIYASQGKREQTMQIADRLSANERELLLKKLSSPSAANPEDSANIPQPVPNSPAEPMTASLRPTILYRERARYTHFARVRKVQGPVVLRVIYYSDGRLGNVEVTRPLPYGLTTEAIRAVKKIRFQSALKDGKPVSVRGNVEFNFTLY